MTKHLSTVTDKFNYNGELADEIQFKTGFDSDKQFYIIFDIDADMDMFIDECRKTLYDNEDVPQYQIERDYEVEFVYADEYTLCSDCYAVIKTSPDSYHWQPDYFVGDGYIVCNKCFNETEDYQKQYIEARLNNPESANQLLTDEQLEEIGFKRLNEESYESGLHEGMNDNPHDILEEINHLYYDILFSIDNVSQFDSRFSVWVRKEVW